MKHLIAWFVLGFLTACGAATSNNASLAPAIVPADSRPLYEQTNIDRSKAESCSVQLAGEWQVSNMPQDYPAGTVIPQLFKCCDNYILLGGPQPMQLNDDNSVRLLGNNGGINFHNAPGCMVALRNHPLQ